MLKMTEENFDAFQEIRTHLDKMETILKIGLKDIGMTESDLLVEKNTFEIPSVGLIITLSDDRNDNEGFKWIVKQKYQVIDNQKQIEDIIETIGHTESLEDYFNLAKWLLLKVVEITLNSTFSSLMLDED
jgi:hypothetical protein